jgi:threonine/homoserine/homoserine lactone efflux protein
MNIVLFIKAFITGIITSMPSGPITFYALHRILERGRKSGLAAGLGSATADTIFALIASLGVMQIDEFLINHNVIVRIISASVLTLLGLRILLKKTVGQPKKTPKLHHEFRNTFLMAIINPPTIFVFLQIFIIFHIIVDPHRKVLDIPTVVGGIMLGSVTWWVTMSYIVGRFKNLVSDSFQVVVRRASGIMMISMAIIALVGLVVK